jgi:hypothetical protein
MEAARRSSAIALDCPRELTVTADARPRLDAPAGEGQLFSLCDAGAIVLVELLAKTANDAQGFDKTKSDREPEIVFGGERHGRSSHKMLAATMKRCWQQLFVTRL